MRLRRRFAIALASFGFDISAGLWAFLDLTDYAPNAFVHKAALLWPPCIRGGVASVFVDVDGHSLIGLFVFTFISAVNAALYFGIGALIGRFLWKSN